MKAKQLVIAGLALAALVACNKEKAVETPLKDGDAYINVKITYSDPVTKGTAANPPFYFGTAEEQAIDNAYFVFYYADGSFCQYVKKEKEKGELKFNPKVEDKETPENVEKLSDAVVVLKGLKSNLYPAYMAVILNADESWIGSNIDGKSISDATKATQAAIATIGTDNDQVDWKDFMMSSSSFDNKVPSSGYYCTKLKADNFKESETDAIKDGAPVEAYVERLAVKVKVEFSDNLKTKLNSNNNIGKIGSFTVNGTARDLYFVVDGWGLNATAKNSYCFKNIDANWTSDASSLGFDWNDKDNFRSYWGKSTNYGGGTYPKTFNSSEDHYEGTNTWSLNYVTYEGLKVAMGSNAYCRENTNNADILKQNFAGSVTSILLKAKVTDAKGEGLTLYNFAGNLYEESNYLNAALTAYETKNPSQLIWKKTITSEGTTYNKVTVSDLNVVISADGYAHVELNDADNYCSGPDNGTKSDVITTDAANKLLNGNDIYKFNTGCSYYKEGMMYYNIPIEHLRNDGKYTDENYEDKEGNYGVVRNHYYIIEINSISNLGKAVNDPKENIVPNDDDTKNYYVAAKINVLSWKVVKQTVDL